MTTRSLIIVALLAGLAAAPAFADSKQSVPAKDLFALDLESLLNLKVITASKFSEKLSDAPGVISVVTRDELKRFGGITLREVLERVPSLSFSVASFTDRSILASRGDQVKIHGGHILYLINGRPVRETLEGGLIGDLLESFPVSALERIEVIKGPGSVLYGSNAFSGVVNLITRKPESSAVNVTALGATADGIVTQANGQVRHGDLAIVASGQFHQQPEWRTDAHTLFGGLEHLTIPDRGKGAYAGVTYKDLSVTSTFTQWKTSYIEAIAGQAQWKRGFVDVGYAMKPHARWDSNVDLTYSRTTLNAVPSIPFIDRDSHEVLGEWTNVFRVSNRNQLTFGALANHVMGIENFYWHSKSTIVDGERRGGAFYAQMDHQLVPDVKLIGGVQANKIERVKLNAVPRVGAIWTPTHRVAVKALYSEAFRAPSIHENFMNYVVPSDLGGPGMRGSLTLRPEEVATFDLSMTYQGASFQVQGGYFHSHLTNNIVLNLVGDLTAGTYQYQNLGTATFRGFESEGKYYVTPSVFVMGSALYQTNEDGTGNTDITPIANFSTKMGVSYQSRSGLSASLFDTYHSAISGYENAVNPKPEAFHNVNAHARVDLSSYLAPRGTMGVAFVVHANNLANRELWLPDWKDTPGDTIFAGRGRSVYVGADVTFGGD